MKRTLIYLFILFAGFFIGSNFCIADESIETGSGWDEMLKFDRSWRTNQKAVSDEEFEKVMQKYEKKKKPKKYEFEANESRDSLNDMSILDDISNHSPLVLFPVDFTSYEGEFVPAGYYKLNYMEKNKEHFIVLTQGRKICAHLKMTPTNDDFKSESIQFAEIRPNDSETMKLIYGNLDLNLYKDLYIKH